jgi:hypothetical protein
LIHPSTTLPASPALPKRRFAAWLSHAAIAPALIFGAALILRLILAG